MHTPSISASTLFLLLRLSHIYCVLLHMTDQLTIYNAHNGESVVLSKPVRYHTLQSFKDFLLESFTKYTIASHENIFLLTSFGMKLNYSMINEMADIYVYDKRLLPPPETPVWVHGTYWIVRTTTTCYSNPQRLACQRLPQMSRWFHRPSGIMSRGSILVFWERLGCKTKWSGSFATSTSFLSR